jgi:hypothetical protein
VGAGVACVLPSSDCEPLDASSLPDATTAIDAAGLTDADAPDAARDAALDAPGDAAIDAATGCVPACGANQVCLSTQTVGGGTERLPDDAGNCPPSYVLTNGICLDAPTFACTPFQDGCLVFDCACAASLCPAHFTCAGTSPGQVDCVFYAP